MQTKNKAVIWILVAVGLAALCASIFSRSKPKTGNVNQSAGPSSVQQSASASGNATINQVAGSVTNLNINQGGLSEEDRNLLREAVQRNSLDRMAELGRKYRHGYLIFGLSPDGLPLIQQSALQDVQIQVNWSQLRVQPDQSGQNMRIFVPETLIRYHSGSSAHSWNNVEQHPFVENQPIPSMTVSGMEFEILDIQRRIFLIGFK